MNRENRPWGSYSVLESQDTFQVKELRIDPGKRLSLQSHKLRAEHWFIISGRGTVEIDVRQFSVSPGESIDIPMGVKHRISCDPEAPLIFIEVQTGKSFEESDIVRFEDDYGRS